MQRCGLAAYTRVHNPKFFPLRFLFFFFNDTATTEIYTLSLHDALPISSRIRPTCSPSTPRSKRRAPAYTRSEEHTSELQSQSNLVCRLLLEKKKNKSSGQLSPPIAQHSTHLHRHSRPARSRPPHPHRIT